MMRRAARRREGGAHSPGNRAKGGRRMARARRGAFPRRRLLLAAAAALGAGIAIAPGVASFATEPTVEAATGGYGYGFRWSPSTVEVKEGGAVAFQNASATVDHGVQWTGGPETPSCPGVPIDEGKTSWKGTCTFTRPGTYTFRCVVHPTEMTGTITVGPNGVVTTAPSNTTPSSATTTTTTATTTPGPPSQSSSAPGFPLAGPASRALKLARHQRGRLVRGSIDVAKAGAGDRLEVDVFATAAALARARHGARVRVGSYSRSSVPAGRTSFSVKLDTRARRALKRHGRLTLTVLVRLATPHRPALAIARSVLERA